jgi:hypothetical protein
MKYNLASLAGMLILVCSFTFLTRKPENQDAGNLKHRTGYSKGNNQKSGLTSFSVKK